MRTIHEEWVAKRRQKQDYDDAVAFQVDSQLPGVSLGDPPVTDADLERLNNKARAVMYDLSNTLLQSQAQLQRPTPYAPRDRIDDPTGELRRRGPAPVIPPVVPLPTPGTYHHCSPRDTCRDSPLPHPLSHGPGIPGPILGGATPVN